MKDEKKVLKEFDKVLKEIEETAKKGRGESAYMNGVRAALGWVLGIYDESPSE